MRTTLRMNDRLPEDSDPPEGLYRGALGVGSHRTPYPPAEYRETGPFKGGDRVFKERVSKLEKEPAELKNKQDAMQLQWGNEKKIIEEIRSLKLQLEELKTEEIRYEREGNLARAAEIKHGKGIRRQGRAGDRP